MAETIEGLNDQLVQVQTRMDVCRRQFVGATKEFLGSWMMEEAGRLATDNPKRTQELGAALSEMKSAVRELMKEVPAIVSECVDVDSCWWSDNADPDEFLGHPRYRTKHERLQKAVGLAAGKLGPILRKYGYIEERDWLETANSSRDSRPFCKHVQWSKAMNDCSDEYLKLVQRHRELRAKLATAKRAKAGSEAADMWDRA